MASYLGISVGKNLIKYAKISKEKNSEEIRIEAYGVKFYDILMQTVTEIIQETKSANAEISVCLTSDFYFPVDCSKDMSKKEISEFLLVQFDDACQKRGLNAGNYDVCFITGEDVANPDAERFICVGASKVELKNLWGALSNSKFKSITGVGPTIINLLPNNGIDQDCLVVNIEDETKITLVKNGQINELIQVPVGMDEVISRLADKYNSYSRAYEACKGVDAYADSTFKFTEEEESIREALMPTLYDLKQRIIQEIDPYHAEYTNVYIAGTGVIVNNIDLYLSDAFPGKKVELLLPYFVDRDRNNVKEIQEVNSALSASICAAYGVSKEEDFLHSGSTLKSEVTKKKFSPKTILATLQEKFEEINGSKGIKSKKGKKKNIEIDGDVGAYTDIDEMMGGSSSFEEETSGGYSTDATSEWLIRVAVSLVFAWVLYTTAAWYIQAQLDKKLDLVDANSRRTDMAILQVENDRKAIERQANEYDTKKEHLQRVIDLTRLKRERSYDVPNFMSQLMFIIPVDVKVTSISIGTNDAVILEAESGRYAQLGYFVSRLKIAGILKDVDMKVVDMSSNIKIQVNGVLPW